MENVHEEPCFDLSGDSDLNEFDCGNSELKGFGGENNDHPEKNGECDDTGVAYKRITELTYEDVLGLQFDTESEACEFYRSYARCHGFVARKDEIGRDVKGNVNMRQLVCNRAGSRSKKHLDRVDRVREHRPLTRINCKAKFRVHYDINSSKWVVAAFIDSHKHPLTPAEHVHLIPSYRSMSKADKAQVDSLHLYGVRTCHIMGLMLGQRGGHADLGFCKKDLYNHIDRQKRAKIEDGDAFAALCYLQAKVDNDPMSFAKFTTTTDGRLQHLFWSNGASRIDYQCFGDVVAFDTTYKKNKYNKPLVIFCGYNHHGQTTIFACALVDDEKTETYKWVLETFCEAMSNKHPNAIVTDGDNAMREAIRTVFLNAIHRLCSWHLQQNAVENVKNPNFLEDFKSLIYANLLPEDFELLWKEVIGKYDLHNNNWANKMYKIKEMWSTAYLRDKLFCGIRTTSVCEGINSFIKKYVQQRNSLVDFLHNFERAVKEYRHNELMSDFKSSYGHPVLTTALHKYEDCAAKLLTRNKFKEVKNEIEECGALNIIDRLVDGNQVKFRMNRFGRPSSECNVVFYKSEKEFVCHCRMFESRGIPCSHIFCAMRHEHMDVIPSSLICKRWTKNAKLEYMTSVTTEEGQNDKAFLLRSGALSAACNRLCTLAAKDRNDFLEMRAEIHKLTMMLEKRQNGSGQHAEGPNVINDPAVVKTKGAPRKKKYGMKRRRCSNCKRTGHYKKRCPLLSQVQVLCSIDEEESFEESEGNMETNDKVNVSNDDIGAQQTMSVLGSSKNEYDVTPSKKQKSKQPTQSSVQGSYRNENDVTPSKKQKSKQPTQSSVQGSSRNENVVYPSKKQKSKQLTQSLVKNKEVPAQVNENNGSRVQNNLPVAFSHGMPMYTQYPVLPMYPNVIPTIPTYHPQNHTFPLYPPQYFRLNPEHHNRKQS